MIKADNYYTITGTMITDLKLKGAGLIIYAVISSFSKNNGCYRGSLNYLMELSTFSKTTVINTLKTLVDRGLIEKRNHGDGGKIEYRVKKIDLTGTESVPQEERKSYSTGTNTLPNNNIRNYKNKTNISVGMEKYDFSGRFAPTYNLAEAEAKAAKGAPVYERRQRRKI